MSFVNPTYLWSLLGLLVPVAIHFWNKSEGKTIKVGSIRLIKESQTSKSSRLQFNEFILLLLRLILVSLICFILAAPVSISKRLNLEVAYVVEPSLLKLKSIRTLVDSINSDNEVYLFAEDFPDYTEEDNDFNSEKKQLENTQYWQLAQQFSKLHSDSIVVFSEGKISGIKGKRPEIPEKVNWILIDSTESTSEIIDITSFKDSLELLQFDIVQNLGRFSKQRIGAKDIEGYSIPENALRTELDTIRVQFYDDLKIENQVEYLKASFSALGKYLKRPFVFSEFEQGNSDEKSIKNLEILVWLSEKEFPDFDTKSLIFKPNIYAENLIEKTAKAGVFQLTDTLHRKNILEAHLAEDLLKLIELHPKIESKIAETDTRNIDKSILAPVFRKGSKNSYLAQFDWTPWLWLAFLVVFIIERILSKLREQ
ncbi:N-terminal double-transmembrane domain-containing protein [Zunongwangia mangrovi]|uniref:N-terminal double-transmembrane domain-containing protein n=1 Tax=Zunongwangia mangrovi TaxID=1334022 RepID=A0A1I1GVW5_9FLAO|nr:BatA domain-containing protein [Zunongwangia mangrovi]SFC15625.1 N-terminal double-transmembrane domain-containing protein [Zunongwangia mangrovi]